MTKPHTCPSCKGKSPAKDECEVCERTGVVWEPEGAQEGNAAANGSLDLTYRREA